MIMHLDSGILEAFQAKALKWITGANNTRWTWRIFPKFVSNSNLRTCIDHRLISTLLNLLRSCLHGDNKDKKSDFGADIALVISNLNSGGAQRVLTNLANNWALKGRRVCVITYNDGDEDFFALDRSVRRLVIPSLSTSPLLPGSLIANMRRIVAIRTVLREVRAKVTVGFVAATNILVILASLGLGSRVVISERNDPARQFIGWPWDSLRQLLYRFADVVTANSQGALETMNSYVPKHKLLLVPNYVEPPPASVARKKMFPTILTVGRLAPQKAYDILLEAFADQSIRACEWRLAIIGDGKLRESLREQAERLGISNSVSWHGRVHDPFSYYRISDIFVLVSRYEGVPNALLEAMSCGLPIIVSDASPGPLEYIQHEITGLVVPVDNIPCLVEALETLINAPELRRRLGEAARVRVAECNPATVLSIWEGVLGLSKNTSC
jgi:glycosyltransferase involved in cell wall biosynthesis